MQNFGSNLYFFSIPAAPFVSVTASVRILPFVSRINGLASGTEMTGRELYLFLPSKFLQPKNIYSPMSISGFEAQILISHYWVYVMFSFLVTCPIINWTGCLQKLSMEIIGFKNCKQPYTTFPKTDIGLLFFSL